MKALFIFVLAMMILLFGCATGTQTRNENMKINKSFEDDDNGETAEERAAEEKAIKENNHGTEKAASSEKIAGNTTSYLRYTEATFNKARNENKVIYLYFYATWCPICKKERPTILDAFDEMKFDDVVGFEVHFNDDNTTDEDRAAARKFGVAYQHTTIILNKKGDVSYRSLSPILKDEIISNIREAGGS